MFCKEVILKNNNNNNNKKKTEEIWSTSETFCQIPIGESNISIYRL